MSNARNLSKLIPSSAGLVQTANIADDAITNAKVADDAIDTAQIADDAVENAQIGAGAVTNTEVNASAAIAATKLGTLATANMPSGSIVQVVTMNKSTSQEHNNQSWTDFLASADTLKITPTSSSNTIIVSMMVDRGNGNITGEAHTLWRIKTTIGGSDTTYTNSTSVIKNDSSGYKYGNMGAFIGHVFAPSTTSEIAINLQSYVYSSKKATVNPYGHSVGFTAMEVKA